MEIIKNAITTIEINSCIFTKSAIHFA